MKRLCLLCTIMILVPTLLSATGFYRYTLGPRDLLAVNVYTGASGVGQEPFQEYVVPIGTGGNVSLPLVGHVKAAGISVEALEAMLQKKYRTFFQDPQVSVWVKEYRARIVYVLGQVQANGPVALDHDDTTLFEVISKAGGFVQPQFLTEGADRRNVIVIRGQKKIVVNLYEAITDREKVRDFLMQAGDRVYVPKPIRRIQVLGGVNGAGEFELVEGMTLLRSIALAGSFTEKSRRDRVTIIRKKEDGTKDHIRIDATRVVAGREDDPLLKDGDIVVVAEW